MIDLLKGLAKKYKSEFIEIRNHIHANPELSFKEFKTASFIKNKLSEFGINSETIAETGVVAIIEGNNPGSIVTALRADIDALPILEENDIPYKSQNVGVMHACGHDVHTTCLLGAAKILNETKDKWQGTVKLIFQPGEEKNPGGASLMIKEGVLENPSPSRIFALHVHPMLSVGKFSFRGGMAMASADETYITIKAKGGHAAAPQFTADTILTASQLVVSLQQIISRNNDPFNPSVLSITAFNGGNATNVIPSEVKLMGTLRAMNETWRFKAHDLIKEQTLKLCSAMGASADVKIDIGYPSLFNDIELTRWAKRKAEEFAGIENIEETELRMGAEDFSFYSQKIPACFFRLGVGSDKHKSNVHTPTFNIEEDAIENGMGMMAWLATAK